MEFQCRAPITSLPAGPKRSPVRRRYFSIVAAAGAQQQQERRRRLLRIERTVIESSKYRSPRIGRVAAQRHESPLP